MTDLYEGRYLSNGYPNLEKMAVQYYKQQQTATTRTQEIFACIERLVNMNQGLKTVCIIGCGPNPASVRETLERGYDAIGIEPVKEFAEEAAKSLGDPCRIQRASSENLKLPDNSQRVVIFQSVLEHVDSPTKSLLEAFRVLSPGGVAFIYTTNRLRISLTGKNEEFNVRFFNWFPNLVKESYVFKHLHYDPSLANFTSRPAVHWYNYTDLCSLGRTAGFSQFYSFVDLTDFDSPSVKKQPWKKFLLRKIRHNPWLRALALWQFGNSIFMVKREHFDRP
jgi:SAM-dependent methyltransferase